MASEPALHFSSILEAVIQALPKDRPIYLVGGAVRDALLGKTGHDLDFCMEGDIRPVAQRVAKSLRTSFYVLDDERQTFRLIYAANGNERFSIDLAAFRGVDLITDLQDRDFTINAMAVEVSSPGQIIDPLHGALDLHKKVLRACSLTTFEDDPLRILRGIRLAASLDLYILPETRQAMRFSSTFLERISPERTRDELFRILEIQDNVLALRVIEVLGVLPSIFPELVQLKQTSQSPPHTLDVWNHTLAVLNALRQIYQLLVIDKDLSDENPGQAREVDKSGNLWQAVMSHRLGRYRGALQRYFSTSINPNRSRYTVLAFSALFHDVAKPETAEVDQHGRIRNFGHEKVGAETLFKRARSLQLSRAECDHAKTIVYHHMRIHHLVMTGRPPTRRAIYRFFRDTGEAGIEICLLTLSDVLGTYGPTLPVDLWANYIDTCRALLESWWEKPAEVVNPTPLLNGHDVLMELGISPGARLGKLLADLREAQAVGSVGTREAALEFARQWQQKHPND